MVNHMAEVAKMLGVEVDEEFSISQEPGSMYKIDSHFGVLMNVRTDGNWWQSASCDLEKLIYGIYTIKRKPWKPKDDEKYWCVEPDGKITACYWLNVAGGNSNYKLGNCYRTREEAEANCDKWVAFYASDEVLEV